MLNSRPAIVVYVESPSRPAAIAVPKYRPDCAAAAPRVLASALAFGIIIPAPAAATAVTAPPIPAFTRHDRLKMGLLLGSAPGHVHAVRGQREHGRAQKGVSVRWQGPAPKNGGLQCLAMLTRGPTASKTFRNTFGKAAVHAVGPLGLAPAVQQARVGRLRIRKFRTSDRVSFS